MLLVTLSSTMRSSSTPARVIFFSGLYMVALGSGGIKSSLLSLGADHFTEETQKERATKSSFFNWFFFSLNLGGLLSGTILVWTEENISWTVGFGVATSALASALVAFVSGTKSFYQRKDRRRKFFDTGELKFLRRLLPIWLTGVVFSAAYAHTYTTFVEQGKAMNNEISSFRLPPATLFAFEVASVMLWLLLYNRVLLPLATPSPLLRIGVGICF